MKYGVSKFTSVRGGLGLSLVVALLSIAPLAHAGGSVDKGTAAPLIKAKDTKGKTVDLKKLVKSKKVVIVDFWASWCEPCKVELPFLAKMQKKYGSKGLQVVGINIDDKAKNMNGFLKGKNINFPILHDPGKQIAKKYSPPNMPTSYLIAPNGKVKFIHKGFHKKDMAKMEKEIKSML